MPTDADVERHLAGVRFEQHGSWLLASDPVRVRHVLQRLPGTGAFTAEGEKVLSDLLKPTAEPGFDDLFSNLLGRREHFTNPAQWSFYWAISKASHALLANIATGAHEPALTASLMTRITDNLNGDTVTDRSPEDRETIAGLHFADHTPGWKEKSTGADFGVALELHTSANVRYVVTLVQAKRMAGAEAVDMKQLEAVIGSSLGSYLFYFTRPLGENGELTTPTAKTAELVKLEMQLKSNVHPLLGATDLGIRLAFELPSTSVLGARSFDTPQRALGALFSLDRQLRLDHLLVGIVGIDHLSPAEIHARKAIWRDLVITARRNVVEGRGPFEDPAPPPVKHHGSRGP